MHSRSPQPLHPGPRLRAPRPQRRGPSAPGALASRRAVRGRRGAQRIRQTLAVLLLALLMLPAGPAAQGISAAAQGAGVRMAGEHGAWEPGARAPGAGTHGAERGGTIDPAAEADSAAEGAEARSGRWEWPLSPRPTVLRPFEVPAHRYGPGHRGLDLEVSAPGAEVRAVEAGTVRFSGMVAGRGVVSILHADGLLSTYEPVIGEVTAGDPVVSGQRIGMVQEVSAASHCPGRRCLHLGARRGEAYLDPLPLLGVRGPSVLLPWEGASAAGAPGGGPLPRRAGPPGAVRSGEAPASGRGAASGSATGAGPPAGRPGMITVRVT